MAEGKATLRRKEKLPDGWEERYDTTHGRYFYVHCGRRVAQLEDPRLKGTETHQYGKDWLNIIDINAPLEDFPWFYGNMSPKEAQKVLQQQPEGTFLVRNSVTLPGDFAISIRNSNARNGVQHDRITSKDQRFVLHSHPDVLFDSIPQLIEYYSKHPPSYGKLRAPLDKSRIEKVEDEETTLPEELENDPLTRELYEKAIEKGTEKDNTIRVMIIGCYGQGKTSLVRQLLKQSTEGVEITDGIEVHRCRMINDEEWEEQKVEDPEQESIQRLVDVAKTVNYIATLALPFERDRVKSEDASSSYDKQEKIKSVSSSTEESVPLNVMGLSIVEKSNADFRKRQSSQISSKVKVDSKNLKRFKDEYKRSDSEGAKSNKDVIISIWDFGGQFVYYATHQIFHSKQAVYLLVFNLTVGLDTVIKDHEFPLHKKTMRDYLKFWVYSVNSFVGTSDGCEPPIILVGTHKDKVEKHINIDEYFEEVRKLFDGSSSLYHIQPDQFAISNKDLSENYIIQLRKCICKLGTKRQQRNVPAKWILLEKALKLEKAKKIVSFEEIIAIDKNNEHPFQTDDMEETHNQIKLFLSYHHARGTFCYFDDDILSNYVVLDPQYLIDAFRCLITSEKYCKVRPKMRKYWDELCSSALLRAELLEEVWKQNCDQDFIRFKDLLTEFLKRHRIISKVLKYDVTTKTFQPQGYYIVPSFLKKSAGVVIRTFCVGKSMSEVSLGYVLENETMLTTLYQMCLSALVGRWPLVKFHDQFLVYDNMVACELRRDHVGILMITNNRLELLVINLCPPDSVSSEVCDLFRRYIEMCINTDMCKFHEQNASKRIIKNTTVRCFHPDHGITGGKDIYNLEELRSPGDERSPCPDKANHCLHLKHILHEWFMHETKIENVPSRKLTSKEYSLLSMAIGKGWRQIGLQLGLDSVAIEHIEMNQETADMRIYEMFQLWAKKEADGATLDVLVRALKKCPETVVTINWDVLKNIINKF